MSYYTLSEIQAISKIPNPIYENNTRKFSSYKKTIFLSHSHKDEDIVNKIIAFLLTMGINVYVDWKDSSMPKITSAETGKKIKDKIVECDKFIVLLTENSKESKWVPWELGFADGKKRMENIAIFPIKRNSSTKDSDFAGLEYMELYPIISSGQLKLNGKDVPSIFPPSDRQNGNQLYEGWLNQEYVTF